MSPARARAMLRAVAANAAACPLRPHQQEALRALSFDRLLTPGECWFLGAVRGLPRLSARQQQRLNEIAIKVERGRR